MMALLIYIFKGKLILIYKQRMEGKLAVFSVICGKTTTKEFLWTFCGLRHTVFLL